MATSSTYNFSLQAGDIIRLALTLLGLIDEGSTISSYTNTICLDYLNMMIKHWQMQGMHLWTQNDGVIVPQPSVATYTLPGASLTGQSTGVCQLGALQSPTVSTAAASGTTTLYVTSTSGMSATDNIMVYQDSGTPLITTISVVNSGTQLTINSATTSTCAVGNNVYSYPVGSSASVQFYPRQIYNVRITDTNGIDRTLNELSRSDYDMIANKTITSLPISFYHSVGLSNDTITLYPVPSDMSHIIKYTYAAALDDINILTNNVPFQVEWTQALVYNLAVRLASVFGKESKLGDPHDPVSLAGQADMYLQDALDWDQEDVDIQFYPDNKIG